MSRLRFLFVVFLAGVLSAAAIASLPAREDYARYVNPFVGTGGHGHTFPGATRPFGMVQVSPDTRLLGWDACAGYHYPDNFIYGVSHTHLSGVGIPDYCDILVAPQTGEATIATPQPGKNLRGYGAHFSHAREIAEPGYYAVQLDETRVGVELTATPRVAFHRYTFPASTPRSLVLDLEHRDLVLDAELRVVSPTEIAGYRRSSAWAKDQRVYFVLRFEQPVTRVQLYDADQPLASGTTVASGKKLKALITLASGDSEAMQFKVALSPVSIDGARRNLAAELPGWDFAAARADARAAWNRVLGKIAVEGRDPAQLRTFYTALYHAYVCPNLFNDADGSYVGRDGQVHRADHAYYTVFSLWDTYRAWHPLMTMLEPGATRDFIRTFLLQYRQGGLLPVWDLAGNETFCMNGYHAVSVIADAYAKGIRGFDAELALAAMKRSATREHFGLGAYQRNGFIAREEGREGVARTLEYAYDDWCIASFAGALGHEADRAEYLRRSQNYRHLFSPKEHFFVARENGGWIANFNPREINFNYTEGNAWHYRFAVPHDVGGLIELFGGDAPFASALDAMFNEVSRTEGREQADVTGLLGQYAQGNEPDHHVAYLYDYAGRPAETQRRVREIMTTFYSDQPDGLCGNEDCGQMSAWYLLSALGFYQVTPGLAQYALGSPLFDRATIDVGGGRTFTIVARNQSPANVYLASAMLNGAPLTRSYLTHAEIVTGGELVLTMGDRPNLTWATAPADRPGSHVPNVGVVPAPVISVPVAFRDRTSVTMEAIEPDDELWYTLDGSAPVVGRAQRYTGPFTLDRTAHVAGIAMRGGHVSPIVHAEAHRADTGLHVTVNNPIDPQYTAGGPGALVDGVLGGPDFTTGRWQGYEDCDLDVVIDLGREAHVRGVHAGFLQSAGSYALYPADVRFEISPDGKNWQPLATLRPTATPPDQTQTTVARLEASVAADGRYVRLQARNPGRMPAWGSTTELIKTYLFCDEIEIDRD
jgi:predicted alpha-1,2-mannosidase